MADKVLQDPTKQKFFDQQSMHELFDLPKKTQGKFLINLRDKEEPQLPKQSLTLQLPEIKKRQKVSEIEELKISDQTAQELEEGEIEFYKPERMYKLNHKNIEKDEKAQQYIKETSETLSKVPINQLGGFEKSSKDLKAELIVQIFKEEEENDKDKDFNSFSNKQIMAYF